jgi:hypothetical protein
MPHKMDEFLYATGLPTDIDVILNSTGDSETAPTASTSHPPYFPYENVDFTSIIDNVSIVYLNLKNYYMTSIILMT